MTRTRRVFIAALMAIFIALTLCGSLAAQSGEKEQAAEKAAQDWLALVDAGKYAESWQEAAPLFKSHVTQAQWEAMIRAAREPLGKVVSRNLKSANYTTSLPGAPDGKYVVIQYDTTFENKKTAVETITPVLSKGKIWRVSGYFIR